MRKWLVFTMAAALGVGACDTGTDLDDSARVSVFLTDAPGDVDAVWIDISGIDLVGVEDGTIELPLELTGMIELTELVGRARELVDDVEVPEGRFEQIRVMIDGLVLRTDDDEVFATAGAELPAELSGAQPGDLQCPSCTQTGIKLVLTGSDADLEGGDDLAFVLDVDVARSFAHPAGASGKWVVRPVIHLTVVDDADEDDLDGADIEGTVVIATVDGQPAFSVPECAGAARSIQDFIPTATAATLVDDQGNAVVRTGDVEADGDFEIDFVGADTWTLGFMATDLGDFELLWTATVAPATVTVTGDDDVGGVVYTLTGATCQAK